MINLVRTTFLQVVLLLPLGINSSLQKGNLAVTTPLQLGMASASSLGAVVLVNSISTGYPDFQHFIQPYLDYFGVPYTVIDISTTPVTIEINNGALIIVGHRQIDINNTFLDLNEQTILSNAINAGSGFINFDNDISTASMEARYLFIQDIFNFGYVSPYIDHDVYFSSSSSDHFITAHHQAELLNTAAMNLAGTILPADATALAWTGTMPFLSVRNYGQGRAVQWSTYDWMSTLIKGPLFGLDDLVWRSMAWAARKPFILQGLPPFILLRVDDVSGPFDWIHIANEMGIKPSSGIFLDNIDESEATDLSIIVNQGHATTSIHEFNENSSFYWGQTDEQVATNFAMGKLWHQNHQIPISKYVLSTGYQLNSNVFPGLLNWGIECVGTHMDPDQLYGAPWIMNGPYRKYETGNSDNLLLPVYYADYLTIPNHPELNNKFFNLLTEIRDDQGYQWYPEYPNPVNHGTSQAKRALDSMALAILYTHEPRIIGIGMDEWRNILQGITTNLVSYNPMYVTLDYACQYIRSKHDSKIISSSYDATIKHVTATLEGATEIATKFNLFLEDQDGEIQSMWVDVPQFSGQTQVVFTLPGGLDHISVTPGAASVTSGDIQQFVARGFDIDNHFIPNLPVTWSTVNGAGSISNSGVFKAGSTPGNYNDAIIASAGSVNGSSSVKVIAPSLDFFAIQAIGIRQYAGLPFQVTITARDAAGKLLSDYTGQATLNASVGHITPSTTGQFIGGVWTGSVALDHVSGSVTISAADGSASGTSNSFNVDSRVMIPVLFKP